MMRFTILYSAKQRELWKVNSNQCNIGIQLAINVAKAAQLIPNVHEDVSVLANICHLLEKTCNKSVQSHQSWWSKQLIWVQSPMWFFVGHWLATKIWIAHSPTRKYLLCFRGKCNICMLRAPISKVLVVALKPKHCN